MTLRNIIVGSSTVLGIVLFLGSPQPAHALTAAQLATLNPNPAGFAVTEEANCSKNLRLQPGTTRADVDRSGPYAAESWLSAQGAPSVDTITVPYGTTSVPLQINKLTMLCSILVQNSDPAEINPNYTWDHSAEIIPATYPDERAPVPGDGASLYEDNTLITAANVVAGSGGIGSSPVGKTYKVQRNNSSRYWFTSVAPFFSYVNPGGLTASETVIIRTRTRSISGFHQPPNTVFQCLGQPNLPNDTTFGPCPDSVTDFVVKIVVQAPVTLSTSGGGNVTAGSINDVGVSLTNPSSKDNSLAGDLQIMYPVAGGLVHPVGYPNLTAPGMTNLGSVGGPPHGFRPTSVIAGVAGENWRWATAAIPVSTTASGTLQITISPTALPGTVIKMEVYFYPPFLGGAYLHQTVTFTVVSASTPVFSAANSDVHAGDCTNLSTGNVTTNPLTKAQYVISASGLIDATTQSNDGFVDNLKLGKNGSYSKICRPDLLAAALGVLPTGATEITPGLAITHFVLDSSKQGVYFFKGTHLFLSGQFGGTLAGQKPITIVTTKPGSIVEIEGDITVNPISYARDSLPSLGIIAAGDIQINPQVSVVNAYLFSDGNIDTCPFNHPTQITCTVNALQVNGFLMGKTISFHRLGPANANGSQISESIVMTPQLYLNPPKFFDATDSTNLEGQGERAPLF